MLGLYFESTILDAFDQNMICLIDKHSLYEIEVKILSSSREISFFRVLPIPNTILVK